MKLILAAFAVLGLVLLASPQMSSAAPQQPATAKAPAPIAASDAAPDLAAPKEELKASESAYYPYYPYYAYPYYPYYKPYYYGYPYAYHG